jgi:hypothetical protein
VGFSRTPQTSATDLMCAQSNTIVILTPNTYTMCVHGTRVAYVSTRVERHKTHINNNIKSKEKRTNHVYCIAYDAPTMPEQLRRCCRLWRRKDEAGCRFLGRYIGILGAMFIHFFILILSAMFTKK